MWAGRRLAWATVVAGVLAAHLWVGGHLAHMMHLGASQGAETIRRIELSFERDLQPAAPPEPVARPARPQGAGASTVAAAPAQAASAPPAEPPPEPAPEPAAPLVAQAQAPAPSPPVPEVTAPAAAPEPAVAAPALPMPVPAPPPAAAPVAEGGAPAPFQWPPSTRLSYSLTGDFRGPVEGSARVEWLRQGGRYQVHLDVAIGPSFAPLVRRRMSSEGELTEHGLKPLRYEEETRVPLAATRRKSVAFEADRIVLQGPRMVPTLAGVQDTASQFVQLTWLFTTQPEQLRTGGAVVVPLALPHRVDRWTYDVMGEETLDTPVGRIATYWIKPRRENWKPGELAIEAWFAPSLQYLPVRIMIRQDAQTYADLLLQRLPQQSGP